MTADQLGEDRPRYAVGVVADRLGLPTATLRSWNRRYGIGPPGHDPGSHRLYSDADIAAVQRMQRLIADGASTRSAARATVAPGRGDPSELLAAAFALDGAAAGLLIEASLRERGVVDTWDSLLRPVFAALSTLQVEGADCLDVEHLLSRITTRALQRVPARTPGSGTRDAAVVLACCDGEVHTLALEALAAALGHAGCAAVMLGGSVPAASVVVALGRLPGATVAVLWSQRASTADPATVHAVTSTGATVMVAGPGWVGVPLGRRVGRLRTLGAAVERLTGIPARVPG
jgi:MerR family transcriptional regulator, light-induced transcriptional regulator